MFPDLGSRRAAMFLQRVHIMPGFVSGASLAYHINRDKSQHTTLPAKLPSERAWRVCVWRVHNFPGHTIWEFYGESILATRAPSSEVTCLGGV